MICSTIKSPEYIKTLAAGIGLLLLTLLIHHGALSGFWRFDDGWLLDYANRFSPWEYFFDPLITRAYSTSNVTPWNPFLFDINLALFGLDPTGFYWHHLLILAATSIASFLLLRLWIRPIYALIGATAFLLGAPTVHIAQKLTVGHYLEGLLFAILGLYFFILGIRKQHWLPVASGSVFYLLASGCKEVFVPLPGVLLFFNEGDLRSRLAYALPYFAWSAVYLGWRQQVLGTLIGGYQEGGKAFDLFSALEQMANIPLLLFGDDIWGLLAISLLLGLLLWAWQAGKINPALLGVSIALTLLPLMPLTSFPGISGPGRYLFLPWWLISMTLAVALAGIPKLNIAARVLLGSGLIAVAGLQAQRIEAGLQAKLAMFDQIYRFAVTAPSGHVLLPNQIKDSYYLDIVLNGARDTQARITGISIGRINIVIDAKNLPLLDTAQYSVWSYQETCRCLEDITATIPSTVAAQRPTPKRGMRLLSLVPPYPPLFENSRGTVDGHQLKGSRLTVTGWVGMHDNEPEQELILIAPGYPRQRKNYSIERPDEVRVHHNEELRYSGFRLVLDYPDEQMARAATEQFCILERSALTPVRVLGNTKHPDCANLHTDRPLGR